MNQANQISVNAALDRLLSTGTVRGLYLGRGGKILVNRCAFSDQRLLSLYSEVELILENFSARGRTLERMVLGFDGGHLVLLVDGEIRLMMMHLIPDEADQLAMAGQAFLAEHGEEIGQMEAIQIEMSESAGASSDSRTAAEARAEGVETERTADGTSNEDYSDSVAIEKNNTSRPESEKPEHAPASPQPPKLAPQSSSSEERDADKRGLRDLLGASRQQRLEEEGWTSGAERRSADKNHDLSEEERTMSAWAVEHLGLPEDASHLLPPKPMTDAGDAAVPEGAQHHSTKERRVRVGAVSLQPVRLAEHQARTPLLALKENRVRQSKTGTDEA